LNPAYYSISRLLKYNIKSFINSFQDFIDPTLLGKNKNLKNIHEGERCIIFGTGSSLNELEISQFSDEVTFGGNFLHYHPDFHNLNLDYFVSCPSHRTLKKKHSKVVYADSTIYNEKDIEVWLGEDLLATMSVDPLFYFNHINKVLDKNTRLFLGSKSSKFFKNNNFFNEREIYYLCGSEPILLAKNLVFDLSKPIPFLESLVFTMLAIAFYMGFKEIILIGCDYSLEPCREFHFYDEIRISKTINKGIALQWINKIAKARKIEVYNILEDEEYYKPIFVSYNRNRDKHKVVNNFAESIGVKIFNIVPVGFSSPVYHGVSWQSIVKNVSSV